jgi:hypothetical protein
LKPKWWGSPLVQGKKYQEKKIASGKRRNNNDSKVAVHCRALHGTYTRHITNAYPILIGNLKGRGHLQAIQSNYKSLTLIFLRLLQVVFYYTDYTSIFSIG